jgi:hypothetical protein
MESIVGPRPSWGQRTDRLFSGERAGHRFTLVRIIGYKNSFIPFVRLAIEPATHGSLVTVSMRMHAFVIAFVTLWMLGASAGGIIACVFAIARGEPALLLALLPPILGAALFGGAFTYEARKADALLRATLPPVETP